MVLKAKFQTWNGLAKIMPSSYSSRFGGTLVEKNSLPPGKQIHSCKKTIPGRWKQFYSVECRLTPVYSISFLPSFKMCQGDSHCQVIYAQKKIISQTD